MSLATLARKTKAKQRLGTRGKFILNMTDRGNVLGMNAKMSRGNCPGFTKCAGKRSACCAGTPAPECCTFKHGGQPAPQMGYGVYLNRKSKGAYHSGGGPQCCTKPNATSGKIVWKQQSNLDASVVITNKKDNVLACNSDVYTAKRDTCVPECIQADMAFTVGAENYGGGANGHFVGVDTAGTMGVVAASISPSTINGAAIRWMGYQSGGNFNNMFYIAVENGGGAGIDRNLFNSITFANCNPSYMRTYYTHDASYNPTGLPSATVPGTFQHSDVTIWIWNLPLTPGGFGGYVQGWTGTDPGFIDRNWWANAAGVTSVTPPTAITVVGPNTTFKVYIDQSPSLEEACCLCLCPVNKNICGCNATDLVRYTRINKSFGCQATKAVRMGRAASEQIARSRAVVDCIKPMYRDIFITLDRSGITSTMNFTGCCGNQCIISGQRYNFYINIIAPTIGMPNNFRIRWCGDLVSTLGSLISTNDIQIAGVFSVTVPNTSCDGLPPASLGWWIGNDFTDHAVTLDYCKQAFKKPQMLGSCSGR